MYLITWRWSLWIGYYWDTVLILTNFSVSWVYYRDHTVSILQYTYFSFKTYYTSLDFVCVIFCYKFIYLISMASEFSVLVKKVILAVSYCTHSSLLDVCKTYFFNCLQRNLQFIWKKFFFAYGIRCK